MINAIKVAIIVAIAAPAIPISGNPTYRKSWHNPKLYLWLFEGNLSTLQAGYILSLKKSCNRRRCYCRETAKTEYSEIDGFISGYIRRMSCKSKNRWANGINESITNPPIKEK